ncbi:MAG: tRNA-dihydrouridine synthase family protein [Oscillibacter sp.]|nr:tRNA-dihydrouridine synthase family protein [Oscillibacter sp.]
MIERYDFAPLDGITRGVYRRVWQRRFGGADRLFIPFFSPTDQHVLTERDRRELLGSPGIPQVPQVMTCRAEDLVWAAELLRDLGFTEVNLNLGCPSGTVTAKGKGAGFLAEPEALDRFFDAACGRLCLPLSVKTRLGVRSPEEFARLLPIFDRYPITCLTIHARVKTEKYRGNVHLEEFAQALAQSRNPVCYNGDLRTVGETEAFASRFPAARAVMIGRGAVADPALFRKLRGGPPATRKELRDFLQELYAEYQRFYGQVGTAAQRMREVWFYLIHLFDDADRLNKKLRRFRSPGEYEAIEDAILRELPLRQDCQGELA